MNNKKPGQVRLAKLIDMALETTKSSSYFQKTSKCLKHAVAAHEEMLPILEQFIKL